MAAVSLSMSGAILPDMPRACCCRGHARGKEFFSLTRRVRRDSDVLVCRLVDDKITYVHRRLWPALLRLAPALGARRLAAIREVHTDTGAHP